MEVEEIQAQQQQPPCKFSRVGNTRNDSSKLGRHHHHFHQDGGEGNGVLDLIKRPVCPAAMAGEGANGDENAVNNGSSSSSINRIRGWHHSSGIIRVSRASGRKDRHSKVWTSKGLRDRRVRLSVTTAMQFYDLQDRLGYDQPSKAVEWLIKAAADSIAELPSLNTSFHPDHDQLSDDQNREKSSFVDNMSRRLPTDEYQTTYCGQHTCSNAQDSSTLLGFSHEDKDVQVDDDSTLTFDRSKRKATETWTKLTPYLVDDGYDWISNGREEMLNSEYPRDYFRCTHRYVQGCQPIKLVQRVGDEYQTTYRGHHTCSSAQDAYELDSQHDDADSSRLLGFSNEDNEFTLDLNSHYQRQSSSSTNPKPANCSDLECHLPQGAFPHKLTKGSSDEDEKRMRGRASVTRIKAEPGNFRATVEQYTGMMHLKTKGTDELLPDDHENSESIYVKPVQPSSPPVQEKQIPQGQCKTLLEPLMSGTTNMRVSPRSSFVDFKRAIHVEQERQNKSDYRRPHPLLLVLETLQKHAGDLRCSGFYVSGSSNECHLEGEDEDKTTLDELRGLLKRTETNLYMHAPPTKSPATGFHAEYFVELNFSRCTKNEHAWLGRQPIGSLRVINFSNSNVKNLPDLSEAHQARSLILQGCTHLVNVSCIQHLPKLEHLNLKSCTNITSLPSMMHLKCLISIDLSHCVNLKRLPPSMGCLSSLAKLNLRRCKRLQNLPISTLRVKSLQSLDISGCSNLIKNLSAAAQEESCLKVSAWEPLLPSKSKKPSLSIPGASSNYTANGKGWPCLERTYPRIHQRTEKETEQVMDELYQTSAMNRTEQSGEKEIPDEPMVHTQTPSPKVATNPWPGESSFDSENSTTTLSCRNSPNEMSALEFYMEMSVEAIHLTNAFGDIIELVNANFHQTSSLQKRANLKDMMCFLEELQGSIPDTVACMRSAQTSRESLLEKLAHLSAGFIESQRECVALDAQLTELSDEEAKLDAKIQALMARKEELHEEMR